MTPPSGINVAAGRGSYLMDDRGRRYLDLTADTALIGHSHPRVAEAVSRQITLVNTGGRYRHEAAARLRERLAATLPASLDVCYLLNSASEATEIALRMARAHVRGKDAIVFEGADHGITTTLINMSPLRFDGPGGAGRKHWVHVASRGGARLGTLAKEICSSGRGLCALFAERIFDPGFLRESFAAVHAAEGVCVAVETETGLGRIGPPWWSFALGSAQPEPEPASAPDIVVVGESLGNGIPIAAVITTQRIAASFQNGMEMFSPTGGNPVACAAALAVLDTLDEERLPERAGEMGAALAASLRGFSEECGGSLRGAGLHLEFEIPNAGEVAARLREHGVLVGVRGGSLTIRPPLVFGSEETEQFLEALRAAIP